MILRITIQEPDAPPRTRQVHAPDRYSPVAVVAHVLRKYEPDLPVKGTGVMIEEVS